MINIQHQSWVKRAKFGTGLLLIVCLFWAVDFGSVLEATSSASLGFLLLCAVFYIFLLGFESLRLWAVFSTYRVTIKDCFRYCLIGMFFNNFTPGMVGADVYQVQQLNSIRPGLITPISLSLYLRFSGFAVNIAILIVALVSNSHVLLSSIPVKFGELKMPEGAIPVMVSVILIFFLLTLSKTGRSLLVKSLDKAKKLFGEITHTVWSFRIFTHFWVASLGALVVLCRAACMLALVFSLGDSVPFGVVLFAVTFTRIAALLPISFAGLGITEITLTAVLVLAGIDPAKAVAVALLARIYLWLFSIVGGVWFVGFSKSNNTQS